jgi:hypothetical protein
VEHADASRGDDGHAGVSGKAVAAGVGAAAAAAAGIAAVAATSAAKGRAEHAAVDVAEDVVADHGSGDADTTTGPVSNPVSMPMEAQPVDTAFDATETPGSPVDPVAPDPVIPAEVGTVTDDVRDADERYRGDGLPR